MAPSHYLNCYWIFCHQYYRTPLNTFLVVWVLLAITIMGFKMSFWNLKSGFFEGGMPFITFTSQEQHCKSLAAQRFVEQFVQANSKDLITANSKDWWIPFTVASNASLTSKASQVDFTDRGPVMLHQWIPLTQGRWSWKQLHELTHYGLMSTLVQIMACCLTAPSHYLNPCWLIISHH